MIDGLLAAIGFLTRIPVPSRVFAVEGVQARSLAWYPLVGALLGAALCALAWAVQDWPPMLAAATVLVAWVAVTGALHLDGLADSADAWVGGLGGGNHEEIRQRTLAIMKDPRSGPIGVVALVLLLLLKFAALASLSALPWWILLLAPVLARAALVAAFLCTPYVRSNGLGSGLVSASRVACTIALLATLALCVVAGTSGVVAVAVTVVVFWLWRRACLRRLGGITGDTCGALTELVEVAVLVTIAAAG
ncbi:cobalamin-5'-phosphate synthase [Luteimonas cucumeris]|uniref:Adenosylcobinamide-GDP ribazoletransferase n=1 Tax=Luteimonas cucumeris TaxID=985012 RepID=A0A562L5A8_9GAMM|nr:adenosylcobinamide-GDP ribazoletransferase [Luteimonas cucumeris]TWI02849.1 cobalamin-5'-phosphate synthase [Luteimonas cucumeris]